jgi:5-methyltetrahydropteroyltriglutamate--homocysteine methyltransferase
MAKGGAPMSTPRRDPPFRAEHVGSMLRPRALKDAGQALRAGRIDRAAFDQVLATEVKRAIETQEAAGLQSITDGELGRSSWFGFFFEALDGFRLDTASFQFKDAAGGRFEWPTCVACGRIHRKGGITTSEFARIRANTTRTPKVTMPTPSAFHFFRFDHPADRDAYPDIATYWDDLVGVYRAELAELDRMGCTYVQFDEVPLAMLCDVDVRAQVKAKGQDPEALVDLYIDVMRRVLEGRSDRMTVGMHLCRGNFRGRWMASGGYEPVAEKLFNRMPVDAFFLEYDSARAGDFRPLRFLPTDKIAVLGLVSSKDPQLEPIDTLRRRLDEAAAIAPLERLALSPQCGFASVAGGNLLGEDEEKAKLARVVETAAKVWG